jgi:hypothetical protein
MIGQKVTGISHKILNEDFSFILGLKYRHGCSHRHPKKIGFLGWVLGFSPNPNPNPKNQKNPKSNPTPNPNIMGFLGF